MNKKKLLMFGLPLLAVVLVSAALLTYYGVIGGIATVTQSVTVEESPITGAWDTAFVAGKTIIDCDNDDSGHSVKNNADVPALIKFGTTCRNVAEFDDGIRNEVDIDWATFEGNECDGIVTEIYGILELTKKDTIIWEPTEDKITITYTIVGDTFEASGVPDEYTLVYYKDDPDSEDDEERLATPGKVYEVIGSSSDLPYADDWNVGSLANYCGNGYDSYDHCKGAKLWLVKQGDISGDTLTWANMADYYYETDLIVYSSDENNEITLPAKGGFNFCVSQDFAFNLAPDTYTIETQVLPVA